MSKPKLTYDLIMAIIADAANRHMRKHGRTSWSRTDYNYGIKQGEPLWDKLSEARA